MESAFQFLLPILPAEVIKRWDEFTIKQEPVPSIDLMERASNVFCNWWMSVCSGFKGTIHIFCGNGNNGGDGLAIARILSNNHFPVIVYVDPNPDRTTTEDWDINFQKLPKNDSIQVHALTECLLWDENPVLPGNHIFIDALFGSGLNRPLSGMWEDIIIKLNSVKGNITRISVDIPSGLSVDKSSKGEVFRADHTATFQSPKLTQLIPETAIYCGQIHILNIGLHETFNTDHFTRYYYVQDRTVKSIVRTRHPVSHKGNFGSVFQYCGSTEMPGAALLCSRAALRTGCGYVFARADASLQSLLIQNTPEVIPVSSDVLPEKISVLAAGCGIGKDPGTGLHLHHLTKSFPGIKILDADALYFFSPDSPNGSGWLESVDQTYILTPHPGEFDRMFGPHQSTSDRIETALKFTKQTGCILILKGFRTMIFLPDGLTLFNGSGNAGLAKAGSGDVLTGIISSLAAQGYSPAEAAVVGVYLHGLAADIAIQDIHPHALLASDVIEYIGDAYQYLENLTHHNG